MDGDNQTRAIEVRTLRTQKKWTQEELAARASVHARTIRNIEAGKSVSQATEAMVYRALGLTTRGPTWPKDVEAFLQMVGYRLTALGDSERDDMIARVTQMLIGR